MDKKTLLYELFKKEITLTSKQITERGFARIYLSMLLEDQKIFKIGRGVYSVEEKVTIDPLYEFQKNNKKIIYSNFTALNLLGFYSYVPKKVQVSVPQGYNATRYLDKEIFYNSLNNYSAGVTKIPYNGYELSVYDLERSICDIIKDESRFDKKDYNRLINHYFSQGSINYQKLLEYSKLLKISKKVQMYLSLFKA